MLALRLARGAHPLVLLRRAMVVAGSAGVGFLLLSTLGYAAAHPEQSSGSLVRLVWCAVPLAAVVQLAVAVARTDPAARPQAGLSSFGFGPVRLALLAAVSTAVSCTLGSVLALFVFLLLHGDFGAMTTGGTMSGLLGTKDPLPAAAVLTLLGITPAMAAAAGAIVLRPRKTRPDAPADRQQPVADPAGGAAAAPAPAPAPIAPTGLPWGVALTAAGLALEAYAGHGMPPSPERLLPMPGGLDGSPPGIIGGWLLTAVGLVFAGPGLTHLCGRLLSAGRPGAQRLLAGRVLQGEAQRIGRPLGVLCAVTSGALATMQLYGSASDTAGGTPFGPLTGLGAALVMSCATATLLTAAVETRTARGPTTAALMRLGAPTALLRRAAVIRSVVLLAVLTPITWVVAELAALPLRS